MPYYGHSSIERQSIRDRNPHASRRPFDDPAGRSEVGRVEIHHLLFGNGDDLLFRHDANFLCIWTLRPFGDSSNLFEDDRSGGVLTMNSKERSL